MNDPADTWNRILEKAHQAGIPSLSPEELAIYGVFTFLIETEGGGISGALYNLSPRSGEDQHDWRELRQVADAVEAVGDEEAAQLLRQAAEILEKVPEDAAPTWEKFMELANSQAPEGFWDSIDERTPNIYNFLEAYTKYYLSK